MRLFNPHLSMLRQRTTGGKSKSKLLWLLTMLVTPMALNAQVQQADTEYCYGGFCYSTLSAAEAAMRAANAPFGAYLTPKKSNVGSATGQLRPLTLTYYVPDQPPVTINPPVYTPAIIANPAPTFCPSSGDPTYTTSCASEPDLANNLAESERAIYQAQRATVSFRGSYKEPFSETHAVPPQQYGWLRHDNPGNKRYAIITLIKDTWSSPRVEEFEFLKFNSFVCPTGFTAKSGINSPGASNHLAAPVCYPNFGEVAITTRLGQVCVSSPNIPDNEGGIPCYPATGDKARFENDFEFAGRAFTRSYHSLRQAGQLPALAPGWVHSYSDRITGNPSVLSEPLILTNDSGYIEVFTRIGSSARFKSEAGANKTIDVEAGNTYKLSEQGNLRRRFNNAGRLSRVESLDSTWSIDFAYVGDRLTTATDYTGKQLQFAYQNNQLASIQLPDGNSVNYSYDAMRNFQTVQYADGATRSYHYNEAALSDANDAHALTGISDNGQRFLSFAYDSKNRVRLSQAETAGGAVAKTQLVYTGDTQVLVTGQNGETRNYALSGSSGYRRITSMTAGNGTVSNTFTGALVLESRDKLQNVTRFDYAADGSYPSARYEAFGTAQERKIVTTRDANYRITSQLIQEKSGVNYVTKQQQTFAYNARGLLFSVTKTDPVTLATRTTTTTYCEASDVSAGTCPLVGLTLSVDGPRTDVSDVTTYFYYANDPPGCVGAGSNCDYRKGNLQKVRNALLQDTQYLRYDNAGRLLTMVEVNNVTTEFEYTPRGWMSARKVRGSNDAVETDDQITRMEYWPNGLVKKVTQPNGAFTSYSYDGAQRLIAIADNAGNSVTYTLNPAGERIKEDSKDSGGVLMHTLTRTYNLLGQLQAQTDAYNRSTIFSYDANSNLDTTTDPLTRVSDNNYDPLNRLSRTLQDMNGIAAETKFSYDALDNLTQVNDPKGLNTTYSYNGFSDLTQLSSPDTGSTSYLYDSAGNRTRQTDARGVVTNFSYDALNRLIGITYPTISLNTSYQYDADASGECNGFGEGFLTGRLVQISDGSGSTKYCYDRFGNVTRKIQSTNGKVFTLRYGYTVAGQLASLTYPDGAVVDYLYDGQGRVLEIGAKTATGTRQIVLDSTSYYAFGPVKQWRFGNARLMKRSLNLNYQPSAIEASAGGLSLGYEFDAVGNLAKLNDLPPSTTTKRQYAYDGLNRLLETKDANNAVQQAYSYDKTGNRTSATVSGTSSSYGYGANNHRLSGVGSVARSYDNAGNTTQIANATAKNFVYADHGRMTQYKEGTTLKMSYAYNGRGEQVRKFASSTTNVYSVYDNDGRWLGDYNNAGTPTQQVIWFGDLPVAMWNGAASVQKLHYIEADALGTPRAVVDPARGAVGTVVWSWDLAGEAFGNTAPNQNPDGDAASLVFNMRFPGQRFDSVSGLNYNYFRDYEAGTGRYVESDPIGLRGGISTFQYAMSRPLTRQDKFGLLSSQSGGEVPCANCAANKKRFDSIREAARTILAATFQISNNVDIEVCGLICKDNSSGKFFLADTVSGTATSCRPGLNQCPSCASQAGWWHTHGAPANRFRPWEANLFSDEDIAASNDTGLPGFLGTPNGNFVSYTPGSRPVNWGPL
jgi:RHS repeat-associated protein